MEGALAISGAGINIRGMSKSFVESLQAYARLAVHVGVNLQKGQRLMVRAPIEAAPLVREITACAYDAGAPLVSVLYHDDQLSLARFQHAPKDSFETFPEWQADALLACAKRGDAFITVSGTDPDLLGSQNPDDVAAAMRSGQKHMAPFMAYPMSDRVVWCVISMPIPAWAAKVFPGMSAEESQLKLWDRIFTTCRVDQADPVQAWKEHIANLQLRSRYLNERRFHTLHYRGPGTDLRLGLPAGHIWKSAESVSTSGVTFVPNMPTEEVFTLGDRNRADGVVKSSKPLNYGGTLIDDFSITFSGGKAVQVTAKKGEATLRKLIETDEGSARIGEIALVPHSSPISKSGLLFYNTLFDENASCHLALGKAYRFTLEGGKEMDDVTFANAGGNNSLVHVDFMIGSPEMDIDGLNEHDRPEPIMRHGEWVILT